MNRRHIQREQRLISNRILVRQALGLDEQRTTQHVLAVIPPMTQEELDLLRS